MNLDQIVSHICSGGQIPTIGAVASEVLRLVNDPGADSRSVGRVVQRDPALTARVLRLANSPYYGARARVATVERAVSLLGLTEIRNIALSVSVMAGFSACFGGRSFDWERFWEHSSGCALIAQGISRVLRMPSIGEEYAAGLLHDVGKILFGHHFPEEFTRALEIAAEEGITMEEAEERVFGANHASLGDWLASQWNFPTAIREAIAHHHHPERAREAEVTAAVVHLANLLTKAKCIGFGGDFVAVCLTDDPAWETLARVRPELADLDVERFTYCLDQEVDAARELMRTAREE